MKVAGVSEKLIGAMLEKGRTPVAAPAVLKKSTTIPGAGLFYKKGAEWKTSGAMRNIASAGIVKKDLNGMIAGASSRNFPQNPMEIVSAQPGGMTINSYVLLPMKAAKSAREFNVGPVNKKSGLAKGALAFGVEKLGEWQFRIVLPTPLGPGEYGILAVVPSDAARSICRTISPCFNGVSPPCRNTFAVSGNCFIIGTCRARMISIRCEAGKPFLANSRAGSSTCAHVSFPNFL